MKGKQQVTKLFRKTDKSEIKNLIYFFNIVTIKIGPKNDREYLVKVREFYSSRENKSKIARTRFCLEMFQIIDREPEFFDILTKDLRCMPLMSQIKAKDC
jgi:uncharacterized protein (DUF2225 family)